MTLKQDKLVKEILNPENKTLRQAGIKAGYSSNTRYIYSHNTKLNIVERLKRRGITKESLEEAYEGLLKLTITDKDHSTSKGILDSIAKLYKLLSDNNNQQVIVFTDDIIQELRSKAVDNSPSQPIDTDTHT